MKQAWMVIALLAAAAAGYTVNSGRPIQAQSAKPQTDMNRFELQETAGVTFLLNKQTGDTWKWFFTPGESGKSAHMGWQYFDRPSRLAGCTVDLTRESCIRETSQRWRTRGLVP